MNANELHHWLAQAAPNPYPDDQVDGIMGGDPTAQVRGVAISWLPNLELLQKCAALDLNFIIVHEPLFYWHPYYYPAGTEIRFPAVDLHEKMATPPAQAKLKLIRDHDLVVYRMHDGWDQFPEHGIGHALARTLGWSDRRIDAKEYIYELPPTRLRDLATEVGRKLDKEGLRFIGDPDRVVRKVTLDWGSPGPVEIILKALRHGCDAAITGEVLDWRDVEFARDAGVAWILGGHQATETPGMQSFYRWFKAAWPGLRVEYVGVPDPDRFLLVEPTL